MHLLKRISFRPSFVIAFVSCKKMRKWRKTERERERDESVEMSEREGGRRRENKTSNFLMISARKDSVINSEGKSIPILLSSPLSSLSLSLSPPFFLCVFLPWRTKHQNIQGQESQDEEVLSQVNPLDFRKLFCAHQEHFGLENRIQ